MKKSWLFSSNLEPLWERGEGKSMRITLRIKKQSLWLNRWSEEKPLVSHICHCVV